MNEDDAKARIAKIEAMQSSFDNKLASLDKDLLATLLQSADTILANPKTLSRLLGQFDQQYHVPVLQQFGTDLLTIKNLNDAYFQGAIGGTMGGVAVNQVLFENVAQRVETLMTDRFGITAGGDIVGNGLFDLFSQDTTVRRQVQQFAYGQKAAGVGLERFKKNMRAFIEGSETASSPATPAKGVWSRHYNTVAYDTYQQADRVAQQAFAEGLNMTAFLYLGGTIAGTRLFCRLREGKCFLRVEIDKMGTPRDSYGGYVNKATGYFSGKPTDGTYSAFVSAGGYFCRHHWSAVSDREAIRRRPDVGKDKAGRLKVIQSKVDRIEPPAEPLDQVTPKHPANRFPEGFTPAQTVEQARQFALDNKLANRVSYEGLHLEVANQINADLLTAKKRYGIRPSFIEPVSFKDRYPMQTVVNNLGSYGLQINLKTLGSPASLTTALATFEQQENRLVWLDGSLSGVVNHELGHMVHYQYISNNEAKLGDLFSVLRALRSKQPSILIGSRYGQLKVTEGIAELFIDVTQTSFKRPAY